MFKTLLIILVIILTSCADIFLSKPVSGDFNINKRLNINKSIYSNIPKKNGIYWFLTGDTISDYSRKLAKSNYNIEYDSLGLYSGYFEFKDNNELRYLSHFRSSFPEALIRNRMDFIKDDISGYKGYYNLSDSLEIEYLFIDAQLIRKFYYEFRAKLSANADTLFVYYEKSRDGKIYKPWNRICVFYPFPDSIKMK